MRRGDPGGYLGAGRVGTAVFHAVDDGAVVLLRLLEPPDDRFDAAEARIDAFPAGGDEVDEEGEVVHTSVALGEEVVLERREPAKELVHQAADLGEVAADGMRLCANGIADATRDRLL